MQIRKTLCHTPALMAAFALLSCTPASHPGDLAECKASLSLCMTREIAAKEFPSADKLIEAYVINGAVSDIVQWSTGTGRKHKGFRFELNGGFSKTSEQSALASVTLAAAAFNSADPYTDAEWLAIGVKFQNDPEMSRRAALLIRNIGYEPWESLYRNPPGLEAIWKKVLAKAPDDFETLIELSGELTYNGSHAFDPIARAFIDRAIALPNLTPEQQYQAASRLVGDLYDADAAQTLMDAGGYRAKDREITREDDLFVEAAKQYADEHVRSGFSVTVTEVADIAQVDKNIAAARLWEGKYSEDSARLFAASLMGQDGYGLSPALETLRRGGAIRELREIANTFLRRAKAAHGDASYAVGLYAGASDAFRMAGDKEKAVAAARAGMPLIPMALDDRTDIPSLAERKRLTGDDNGMRVAPALALFRAGNEKEALASGYVSGLDLLQEWNRPLADFDPHWITDGSPKWFDVVLSEVLDRGDQVFAARLYDAIAETSLDIEPVQLTVLAAAAGKTDRIEAHIKDILAQAADTSRHSTDRPYYLLQAARARKAVEILLARQPH